MTSKLKILKAYSFKENLQLILIGSFNRTIGRYLKKTIIKNSDILFSLKWLLESLKPNSYQSRRIRGENIFTIKDIAELGNFQIILRRNSTDPYIFKQIFCQEIFEDLFDEIEKEIGKENIRYIVDAGAYIGCSTIYFRKKYFNSTIICIEPEIYNYNCLLKNIQINDFRNIIPLNSGLWFDNSDLEIKKECNNKKSCSFSLQPALEKNKGTVKGIAITDILCRYSMPYIDILKIDIEGAERFIFENENQVRSFLPLVRYLVMEIHDKFIIDQILVLLSKFNFNYFFSGRLIIAANTEFNHSIE